MTYEEWIKDYLKKNNPYGRCKSAVEEMIKAFPELTKVAGHVETDWGRRAHWWCKAPDGSIVDPTVSQFGILFSYEPFVPGSEVRVGRCMECGDEIWEPVFSLDKPPQQKSVCSKSCEDNLIRSMGSKER